MALPAPMIATALIGVALAGLAGLAPVRIPGTKLAMTGGEVFVFLMLLFLGVPGAVLAASTDAAIGAARSSKR